MLPYKQMKIGYDAKRAFANFTGLGNYARSTISNICIVFPAHEYYLYTPTKVADGASDFIHDIKNAHIRGPRNLFYGTFSAAWRRFGIAADAAHDQIDLYHGLSHEIPDGIEKTNIKTVVTIHDLIFKRFPHYYKKIDRKIYDNKIKHAVKFAHTIIAISEQTKKDIIEFYQVAENKIEVIYQACDAIFEKKQTSVEINLIKEKYALPANYLLYVGTIEERKNALVILQAMLALPSHVKLVMVGKKKSYGLIIDAFIKKHELNDRVIQINQVDFKDLPAIYQAATIFIYPSKFEGFGIPIIEALHSETPVIAAKGSCLAEAGGPNSLYFEPSNAEELTGLIADLLADESKRKSMAASGKKYVEKFNGDKIATELMCLYQSILSR
jgi:glycosyltransferase involved in cell wall biosynthesis